MSMPMASSPAGVPARRAKKNARKRTQTDRIFARVSRHQKDLFERAAQLEGRTLTEFLVVHMQEAAEKTIHDRLILSLSTRDSRRLFDAVLSPWEPSDALREEVRQMQDLFASEQGV
jgi:uncharacterized protein (DUF1778 family)